MSKFKITTTLPDGKVQAPSFEVDEDDLSLIVVEELITDHGAVMPIGTTVQIEVV